jgi:hypothetical protein
MPRYYFQVVEDGVVAVDQKGLEIEELDTAELDAAIAMAEMMANRASAEGTHTITVLISDETKQVVARVILTRTIERFS